MQDVMDIVKNVEGIYESDTAFSVLKDFERVLDELDLYVYDNWEDGELASGPKIEKHWISCEFMWPKDKMPDPMGGKRLLDYDCKVSYKKSSLLKPRKIRKPDDIRPGSKKGKLDRLPIWLVNITMPKDLILNIYSGYKEQLDFVKEPATASTQPAVDDVPQDAEVNAEGGAV
jgi:hypothetical protein|tara:strand:- start:494 stop:1012 length:519 start_codon:yes stop_codon:yes gene_type:complete